jgi:ABC-type molybdate transport system ATPase subunit
MLEFQLSCQLEAFQLEMAYKTESPLLVLMGPSGAGKTTCLDMISGLREPDHGLIRLNGRVLYDKTLGINLMPRDRKVGYIFQTLALFPHKTVMENVSFGADFSRPETTSKLMERLEFLKILQLAAKYPGDLSGGERQRVAIARALSANAEILLMDEPFASLDRKNRDNAIQLLLSVHEHYQTSMVLVTHSQEEAEAFPAELIEISEGKIVGQHAAGQILSEFTK